MKLNNEKEIDILIPTTLSYSETVKENFKHLGDPISPVLQSMQKA